MNELALSALNAIDPSCSRDEWVKVAMAAKAAGLTFEDYHEWSKSGANYKSEKDCRAVWKSINEDGGVTEGTLYYLAKEHGWCEFQNQKSNHETKDDSQKFDPYAIWEKCLPALPNHEYILQKQGEPDGLRYYPSTEPTFSISDTKITDYLVVPCWSNGEIQTLVFIPPYKGGKKLNLPGASFKEGYFTVGDISDCIYITEGLGHAWAAYQASGYAAMVSFGSGRMKTVAFALRKQYPKSKLVIVADRGKEKLAHEIASSVDGFVVELPQGKPENYDINDYAREFGHEILAELLAHPKIPSLYYKLCLADELPDPLNVCWLLQGIFPAEGIGSIYGESCAGKSFLALDLACAIVTGATHWFGRRVAHIPVTYICLEGVVGLGRRIKAWEKHYNQKITPMLKFVVQPFNLLSEDIDELVNAVRLHAQCDGLIIIDTLSRSAPGADENSSVDMGKIIAAATKLQGLIKGFVLTVHHTGKDKTKGPRGHYSFFAALDGVISVEKSGDCREWVVSKSKDDEMGARYPFELRKVELGIDKDGDEVSSCVVLPTCNEAPKRKLPPKSGNQKIIWDGLNRLLSNTNDFGKAGAPEGLPCIKLEDAVEKTRGELTCEPKRHTERARAAITELVAKRLLMLRDGWLWLS